MEAADRGALAFSLLKDVNVVEGLRLSRDFRTTIDHRATHCCSPNLPHPRIIIEVANACTGKVTTIL